MAVGGELWRDEGMRRAMYVSLGLQIWQQISGVNAFIYYTPTVLKEAGIEGTFFGVTDANAVIHSFVHSLINELN
jgi:hypothetical protein